MSENTLCIGGQNHCIHYDLGEDCCQCGKKRIPVDNKEALQH